MSYREPTPHGWDLSHAALASEARAKGPMPPAPALPLAMRPMRDGDLPFVVSTWAQSLAPQPWLARDAYKTNMRRVAALMVRRARCVMLVSSELDSTIYGWACGEDGVVHHAYVRPEFRTNTVARAWVSDLLREAMRNG